ncbi:helix-turn-helix transcriptional regulator [Desulforudis sp. 1088]|uniref:helix-turn-helix transcriptional regulator n=1 Tax=unclassified Candidatus Desulforudis TaxID=2635950 RepID=UPI00348C0E49
MSRQNVLNGESSEYAAYLRAERLLQPGLLLLLSLRPMHGYELIQMLNGVAFTGEESDPATVYRNLRRMEDDGLVHSQWEAGESGPARRVYHLTVEGEHLLDMMAANARRRREQLEAFLRLFENIRGGLITQENIEEVMKGDEVR